MTTETDRAGAARPRGIGRIDPALRDAAASLAVNDFRAESLPAERERADRIAADRAAAVDTANVAIADRVIPGPGGQQLGLRLYRGPAMTAAPLVIYAHGGGFVTGNLDTDHAHCVQLARDAGCLVVSVDYRLAPEHPCPAALDDVEAAFRYVVDNSAQLDADRDRGVVMGGDAGPRVGALSRPRRGDGAPRSAPSGEPGRPAAGIHQLRRDRPMPRRSHRLREPTAPRFCAHRVARCRSHVPRVRLGGAGLGCLAGEHRVARADAPAIVRRLVKSDRICRSASRRAPWSRTPARCWTPSPGPAVPCWWSPGCRRPARLPNSGAALRPPRPRSERW